jgi:outer membrane protein assembly factor BamB
VNGDYGNAFVKVAAANGQLGVADYFAEFNVISESDIDQDLGSGGAMLLPDVQDSQGKTRHLAVGAGKDTNIYVVDRDNMGKFNPNRNNIYQELPSALGGPEFGAPAYFNGHVYYGAVDSTLKAFALASGQLSSQPSSQTRKSFGYPGTTPSISANGSANGIVWAAENGGTAVLHAYDASDLTHELYNSNQPSGGRDHFGTGNKFITPMVANGKVFVGTTSGVGVFGLLH